MTDIKNIDVTEYPSYEDTDHILVDVREVDEYEAGHLPGAVNLPLSTFSEGYEDIPEGKAVVLVCKAGGRSLRAAQFLAMQDEKNYTELVNLDGGTDGWVEADNEIEK